MVCSKRLSRQPDLLRKGYVLLRGARREHPSRSVSWCGTRSVRSGSRANGGPVQHRGVLRSSLALEQNLGKAARKTATAYSIWNFKHSVAEAFSAADENSVGSLDGSKHATV